MSDTLGEAPCAAQIDNVLIVTRFAYFGTSGWKHQSSTDPELLFAQDRLEARLSLLKAVNLASLAAQSDQDFHHYILTSKDLPDWAKERLHSLCKETYGKASRFTIHAAKPAPARSCLRSFMQKRYGESYVTQIVLDDDDGLANNFVEIARQKLRESLEARQDPSDRPYFLSFPCGFGLTLGNSPLLHKHRYPFINLGLTMHALTGDKNILGIQHKKAPERFGYSFIYPRKAMWLRSLHDFNDSRVAVAERWQSVENPAEDQSIRDRFPYLFAQDAPWANEIAPKSPD